MENSNRKIDTLAKEKFNGDLSAAIRHILENAHEYNCDEYYCEFTDNENIFVENILFDMASTKHGNKEFKKDPLKYIYEIKKEILPLSYQQEFTLTREKIMRHVLFYKNNTADYIMKFSVFITILIYIFAIPASIIAQNYLILLYCVPVVAAVFAICFVVKKGNEKAILKAKEKGFTLIKATCTDVTQDINLGEASIPSNTIYFNGNIKYTDYENLAMSIRIGEPYYLVCVGGVVKKVYSQEEWTLDSELSEMVNK